ncbi:MAG: acyl carrier protein [Oscillospiraceae bacterium]|jgi:acyl carrier protein
MTREEVYERLNGIFRELFDDETIVLDDKTTAGDIEGWDSLRHITLISVIEDEFGIEFEMKDIVGLKNVGELVDVIIREL